MPDIFKAKEGVPKTGKRPPYIHRLEGRSQNPLSAYFYFPERVKFSQKDSKEKIVLFLRKHPITNVGWIVLAVVMFLCPLVLEYFPILSFLPESYRTVAVLLWYAVSSAFTLEKFLDWFFNVCIITDERMFDVDFVNLIYREINEANLDQIQDVTVKMGGVIRTIFDYGDVYVQTAGEIPRIEFEAVPHPDRVAKILRGLRVEEEQEKIEGRVR